MPTPGSPVMVTSWTDGSSTARVNVWVSSANSLTRPTNGVRVACSTSTPNRLRAESARQIGSGSALPFTVTGSIGS